LARQAEPAADVLERLRFRVVEPVAEDDHLPLAFGKRGKRLREPLAATRILNRLFGQWVVVGDEVAEDRVLLLADRLVEARRSTRGGPDLMGLGDRQVRLLGDLLERWLATERCPERPLCAVQLLLPLANVGGPPDLLVLA